MRCQYCGTKIGLIRLAFDRQFCSRDHRKKKLSHSARALRDNTGFYGYVDPELDEPFEGADETRSHVKKPTSQDTAAAVMGLAILGVFLLAWPSIPSGSAGSSQSSGGSTSLFASPSRFIDMVRTAVRPPQVIRLNDDFHTGISGWEGLKGTGDWSWTAGRAQPGNLKLWKPSMQLADYQMDFEGSIQRKSVSWAFRAADFKNYYATKINLTGGTGAEIVRYGVFNGQEGRRTRLPLPMPLRSETAYKIQMRVQGDRYLTSVNGQLVDSWYDGRLRAGGIGFFADKGEVASIHTVRVSELRDPGILGKLLTFGVVIGPLALPSNTAAAFEPAPLALSITPLN